MAYHFKNLVFEGGGVKGIAYVGAMEEFENRGITGNISRVGGTSAGAINALITGLRYNLADTSKILWSTDFGKFMDGSWGAIRDAMRLVNEFGWYKGDYFRQWIGEIIAAKLGKPDATFADAKAKGCLDMYFIGTNLSTGFAESFSAEKTPDMPIVDAVRISMSIPVFFAACRNKRGDVYVDGGALNNYPVRLFDRERYVSSSGMGVETGTYARHNEQLQKTGIIISPYIYNKETLGFKLDSAAQIGVFRDQKEPQHYKINNFVDYMMRLLETVTEAESNSHLDSNDWHRTIYVDTLGVKTTEFNLTAEKKNALIESGRTGVKKYFEWYDDPASHPVNRPDAA